MRFHIPKIQCWDTSDSEYLLDQTKYEKALQVLSALPASVVSYYAHFLKGFAFENLSRSLEAEQEYAEYNKFKAIVQQHPAVSDVGKMFFCPPAKYNKNSKMQKEKGIRFKEAAATSIIRTAAYGPGTYPPESRSTSCASTNYSCKATYYAVWIVDGEAMSNGGTVGMGRAVGWNIRARVFNKDGKRICFGATDYCFNYASAFPLATDVSQLIIRYFEVMNTGGYAGLRVGNYTTAAEQIAFDIYYGRVPDPKNGLCPPGVWAGDACNAYCSTSTYWGAFDSTISCMEFRAGQLQSYISPVSGASCYKFVPMSTPGGAACGSACWGSAQVLCPRTVQNDSRYSCWDSMYGGFYDYSGPVYGNFCWSFVR